MVALPDVCFYGVAWPDFPCDAFRRHLFPIEAFLNNFILAGSGVNLKLIACRSGKCDSLTHVCLRETHEGCRRFLNHLHRPTRTFVGKCDSNSHGSLADVHAERRQIKL
jgi:hypothetical protein